MDQESVFKFIWGKLSMRYFLAGYPDYTSRAYTQACRTVLYEDFKPKENKEISFNW